MKNILSHWKTTLAGLLILVFDVIYIKEVDSPNVYAIIIILLLAIMLTFAKDTLIKDINKFLQIVTKKVKDKEL